MEWPTQLAGSNASTAHRVAPRRRHSQRRARRAASSSVILPPGRRWGLGVPALAPRAALVLVVARRHQSGSDQQVRPLAEFVQQRVQRLPTALLRPPGGRPFLALSSPGRILRRGEFTQLPAADVVMNHPPVPLGRANLVTPPYPAHVYRTSSSFAPLPSVRPTCAPQQLGSADRSQWRPQRELQLRCQRQPDEHQLRLMVQFTPTQCLDTIWTQIASRERNNKPGRRRLETPLRVLV